MERVRFVVVGVWSVLDIGTGDDSEWNHGG